MAYQICQNYIGLVKNNSAGAKSGPGFENSNTSNNKTKKKASPFVNSLIELLTAVKRIQFNYAENNGTFLPGYLQTPDFIGSFKPTFGYVFGSQRDIRYLAARNGWS